jgi:hypothetical protein
MLTIALLLSIIILGGFIFRKQLTTPINKTNSFSLEPETYMGMYIGISTIILLTSIIIIMAVSRGGFKKEIESEKYDMVQVNNSFINVNSDKYGNVKYSYAFVNDGTIITGTTDTLYVIPTDDMKPYVIVKHFDSALGYWGFGINSYEEYKFLPYVNINILNESKKIPNVELVK